MTFLSQTQIQILEKKLSNDPKLLENLYKSKKSDCYRITVDHNLAVSYLNDGWTVDSRLKSKSVLKKK